MAESICGPMMFVPEESVTEAKVEEKVSMHVRTDEKMNLAGIILLAGVIIGAVMIQWCSYIRQANQIIESNAQELTDKVNDFSNSSPSKQKG